MKKTMVIFMCVGSVVSGLCLGASDEKASQSMVSSPSVEQSVETVALNTADEEALESLKGLSDTKAKSIIAYREAHGDFSSLDDLTAVHGIGEKLLSKLKKNNPSLRLN